VREERRGGEVGVGEERGGRRRRRVERYEDVIFELDFHQKG
jgi:hypothetical protein